jgi:hypothetical protein
VGFVRVVCGNDGRDIPRDRRTTVDGVTRLREKRGEEKVSFNDVADHVEDFVRRDPGAGAALDRFAGFLAGVEDVEHEHDGVGPTL